MNCRICHKPLSGRGESGYCRGCRTKAEFADPERRARAILRVNRASRARLLWCPLEYRDTYRRLTRVKQLPAAEARAAILDLIAADARAYARTGELQQSRRAG
jgi:hypothetical protein